MVANQDSLQINKLACRFAADLGWIATLVPYFEALSLLNCALQCS